MKKKIVGIVAGLSLVTSLACAAPLNDFSQGKVAVDISARPSGDFKVNYITGSKTYDANTNWEYGLTVGLGNKFAVEYKNFNPKTKDNAILGAFTEKLDTQEFNILYKANDNFTIFTGFNKVKSSLDIAGHDFDGDSKTNWQIGVTGQTKLSDKITGYATVAAGKDSSVWKIGAAYAIDKNLDFNLFYAENKYDKVKYNDSLVAARISDADADYTIKGVGYGLTYKF